MEGIISTEYRISEECIVKNAYNIILKNVAYLDKVPQEGKS